MVNEKMKIMKRYIVMILAVTAFWGCQHDIAREVDFNVTFDQENTYFAGEPVRFNISGEVDNLLFYSGEHGSNYAAIDRTEIPMSTVTDLQITADYMAKYAEPGHLEVWISDNYEGLYTSDDPKADSAAFAAIASDPAAAGWMRLKYDEGPSSQWTQEIYSLADSTDFDITSDKLCLAFHWCAPQDVVFQRQYGLNGTVEYEAEGRTFTKTYKDLGFKTISLNEDTDYNATSYNGCKFQYNTKDAQIFFNGFDTIADKKTGEVKDGYKSPYRWDVWMISTPFKTLPVEPDKGVVIKNVQNSLTTFEHTWKEPGTYTIVFVGTCANYLGSSKQVKELTVNILEKIELPL